ncbi:MAG TPA: DUF192 domain-containing protein [Patescibacteria group bacterium]|nr:DUF192 domain-containing protein [Patescibacteria group bacterium]
MPNNATAKTVSARKALFMTMLVAGGAGVAIVATLAFVPARSLPHTTLAAGDHYYSLQVAADDTSRTQGLGGVTAMPANQGMLFKFSSQQTQCFWMKDMHFPLDMLWLNAQHKVTHITPNIALNTYPHQFCYDGKYVVELNAGQAATAHIHEGETLTF